MALTDTFVRQVKHSGRPAGDKYADGGGLHLLVKAPGKYWRMAYRHAGKAKLLSFGVYPGVSLAQARQKRDKAKELLAEGTDPSAAKREEKQAQAMASANTVEVVARAWLAIKKEGWSAVHYADQVRSLEKDLLPFVGSRPIGDVTPRELFVVVERVQDRGAVEGGHRLMTTARGVWQYAVARGLAERDITQDTKGALKKRLKGKYPAVIDPVQLGALLRASDSYEGGTVVRAALFIAPILFQRPGNLRTMRWADLDLEAAVWTVPSAALKRSVEGKLHGNAHLVPLPRQVVEAVRQLHPLTGMREYVFPGRRDPRKPMSDAAVNAALHALGYKGIHCWHGYRATGRTLINRVFKVGPDVLEAHLAHIGGKSHGGAYDRETYDDERTDILQRWADYLDKLRIGAEVIPIGRAA